MYILVNYDSNWKYPKFFNTFNDAFMMYELLNDPFIIIEYFDENNEKQIVWKNEYEIYSDELYSFNFLINNQENFNCVYIQ